MTHETPSVLYHRYFRDTFDVSGNLDVLDGIIKEISRKTLDVGPRGRPVRIFGRERGTLRGGDRNRRLRARGEGVSSCVSVGVCGTSSGRETLDLRLETKVWDRVGV